jgi:hypothetical protein
MKTSTFKTVIGTILLVFASFGIFSIPAYAANNTSIFEETEKNYPTLHKAMNVNGVDIFYIVAGNTKKTTKFILHGYTTTTDNFSKFILEQ